jgi:Zn-dependent alcohol dehydrogenase
MRSVKLAGPGTGEARVSVRASGVNPTDYKSLSALLPGSEPIVLGFEAAGVITALGPATEENGLAVGTR